MTRIVYGLALVAAGLLVGASAGCSNQGAAEPQPAGPPPVAVGTRPVVSADLVESIDVVGSLAPKFWADVKSEISGIVTDVYVTEWVPVRKGARLARLDSRETEAGIEALEAVEAQAKVAASRARREFERGRAVPCDAVRKVHAVAIQPKRDLLLQPRRIHRASQNDTVALDHGHPLFGTVIKRIFGRLPQAKPAAQIKLSVRCHPLPIGCLGGQVTLRAFRIQAYDAGSCCRQIFETQKFVLYGFGWKP